MQRRPQSLVLLGLSHAVMKWHDLGVSPLVCLSRVGGPLGPARPSPHLHHHVIITAAVHLPWGLG